MREAAAQEIRTIDVTDKHIEFCRGCFVCKYNGGHCAIDDDMREILEQMLGSDLLLFSYPLYCYGMPAGLKNLIDRTLPPVLYGNERGERALYPCRSAGLLSPAVSDDLRLRVSEQQAQL